MTEEGEPKKVSALCKCPLRCAQELGALRTLQIRIFVSMPRSLQDPILAGTTLWLTAKEGQQAEAIQANVYTLECEIFGR
jgi:hypothetical protein